MNEIKLQEGHPVDENLRPIKVGGETTALEVSKDDVRVNNLYVNGTTSGVSATDDTKLPLAGGTMTGDLDMGSEDIVAADGFTIDVGGDMSLDAAGGDIALKAVGNKSINLKVSGSPIITMYESGISTDDYFKIQLAASGATVLQTVDAAGSDGDLLINIDGDITLNSETGVFDIKKSGTKFADMYAGMILGYTVIGLDATPASYGVSNAMVVTDATHKVSGVVPPSGNIEIFARIWAGTTQSSRPLTFGLSDNASWNSVAAHHESVASGAGGADYEEYSSATWYITGLTAGSAFEYWLGAGCTTASRWTLRWGGDSSSVADSSEPFEYQPFVMKATALPATIYTG